MKESQEEQLTRISNGVKQNRESFQKRIMEHESVEKLTQGIEEINYADRSSLKSGNRAMAFEIPANGHLNKSGSTPESPAGSSLIKLHPPRKKELGGSALGRRPPAPPSVTPETLQEKQKEAETRRKEAIRERVKSANRTSLKSAQARQRAVERRQLDQLVDSEIEAATTA